MVQAPIVILSSLAGTWLFYIQHQFERTYWRKDDDWNFHEASFYGSSYYRLPRVLQWFTANIGLHHVHHLCSQVPNYRLQECFEGVPELRQVRHLTLLASLKCVWFALWDEEDKAMIRFRDLKRVSIADRALN